MTHPNRAVYVVDWDNTCVAEEWPGMGDWLPGAVEGLRTLSAKGKTVIYSLRCHRYEVDDITPRSLIDVTFEFQRIRAKLDDAGLTGVEVYPNGRGKPPGKFYIDDRAIRFIPKDDFGWTAVLAAIDDIEEEACVNAS